jgi:hypothetical protein
MIETWSVKPEIGWLATPIEPSTLACGVAMDEDANIIVRSAFLKAIIAA